MRRTYLFAIILVLIIIITGTTSYLLFQMDHSSACPPPFGGAPVHRSQLSSTTFDAVTKFALPSPNRGANAISAAPDGSVWFGEEALPGVGHLYPNGTLIEYVWPMKYSPRTEPGYSCSFKTEIWGMVLWNGKVWASDTADNAIVGLEPSSLAVQIVKVPHNNSFPYALTTGPNNSLWFTEIHSFKLAKIDSSGALQEYQLPKYSVPTEVAFVNDTLGYYTDPGIAGFGSLVSFNPTRFSFSRVGGAPILYGPDSVAIGGGGVWVAQHGGSAVAFYNLVAHSWRIYPTSNVGYVGLTLPYFVKANGSTIWFNEHFADRVGAIDRTRNSLVEYSLSNPPANNFTKIGDAQTIALGSNRVWFTELTNNSVGYIDATRQTNFSTSTVGNTTLDLRRGGEANLTLVITGQSSKPLSIHFSDTESRLGSLENISIQTSGKEISSLSGAKRVPILIETNQGLATGSYTIAITVTDGLVYQSVYIEVRVLA